MKRLITSAVVLVLAFSCESETEKTPEVPTAAGVTKEVATSVKDVVANKGPKWKVEYSGDLSGSLEGGILQATPGTGMQTVLGKGMNKDRTGGATESIQVTFMQANLATAQLTLADGTKCKTNGATKEAFSKGDVQNADPKSFKGEAAGELVCGPAKDKKISYKAMFTKKP